MPRLTLRLFLFIVLLAGASPGRAQPAGADTARTAPSLDRRLLVGIYHVEAPAFRYAMRAVDATAYPVFVGAPVAAWGGAWLLRDVPHFADAYRLTITELAAAGLAIVLKRLTGRQRPYAVVPGITSRASRYREGEEGWFSYAFPSGHATLAFAVAASWSLSHPAWYVIAPGFTWAAGVAVSRVWLGVHYPSDVLAGAFLGTAVALGVHLLGPLITPEALRHDREEPSGLSFFYLRVPLPP